ncbi:MerR family transcriptional regulator [Proteiniborus sp. DW1]|uniref:MerR family transcriptional regulator n=1 Tax=Proteiniborus sp. DW1 TaxID=1889883 RepID=UPI00092DF7D9|nr:MerR family transcriptional regulator [Proteiniborus sp. DW1]SCG83364.1 MerR family transcriptional regulator [Proteiniborus sp. DW1]
MYDTEKEYTISEVSEITGYQPHVIRYYEKEFELEIPRNNSNHRYYTYKELEIYNYIKALQEKGFTNKQIKLIINSPELVVTDGEMAVTNLVKKETDIVPSATEIYEIFKELITEEISSALMEKADQSLIVINELKDEIAELRNEINSNERDVLICENIKLKMQLKEKSYQVVELKDKLKKEQESKSGFFTKLFKRK